MLLMEYSSLEFSKLKYVINGMLRLVLIMVDVSGMGEKRQTFDYNIYGEY